MDKKLDQSEELKRMRIDKENIKAQLQVLLSEKEVADNRMQKMDEKLKRETRRKRAKIRRSQQLIDCAWMGKGIPLLIRRIA